MQVFFRVDASLMIGSGHIYRCLTLADALRQRGATPRFVCRELPGHLCALVQERGYPVDTLPGPAVGGVADTNYPYSNWLQVPEALDAQQTAQRVAAAGGADWLVVDHYALGAAWYRSLRAHVKNILVIDDLADRDCDADLLLDPNLGAEQRRPLRGSIPQLLGPHYALLRAEFAQARATLRRRDGELKRLLVFLGGVDAGDYTTLVLKALSRPCFPEIEVDVVVGASNPHASAVAALCAQSPRLHFHQAVSHMAPLMDSADLSVGAGGSTTWERACLGLPTIILVVADNQRPSAQAMTAAGCALMLEAATAESLAAIIESLRATPERLQEMSRRNLELVDGRGAARVARVLLPPTISLRRVHADDGERMFLWRNHEDVRRYSHSTEPIEHASHQRWFSSMLANPQWPLLIAEHVGEAVGVLRYDLDRARAQVSIYLVPGRGGGGFGPAILRTGADWLRQHHPEVDYVVAEVLPENAPSHRAFIEAGYTLQQQDYIQRLKP